MSKYFEFRHRMMNARDALRQICFGIFSRHVGSMATKLIATPKQMAAECLGAPAFFQYRFPDVASIEPQSNDVVWVNKRYTPTDFRSTTPAQRWKFVVRPIPDNLPNIPQAWRYQVEPFTL